MNKSATINARIDEQTKKKAQSILKILNIPMSEAISMFLRQIILHKGIPFEIKIPNEVTLKAHELAKEGKEIHKYENLEDLFEALEI